jgi:hypothetical protein
MVTSTDVQAVLKTQLAAEDINVFIATAQLLVDEELASSGLSTLRLDEITKYLAAHFCTLKEPEGRLTSLADRDVKATFAGSFKEGLKSSLYGQTALALDTSGTLSRALDSERPTAIIDCLFDDYNTGEIE